MVIGGDLTERARARSYQHPGAGEARLGLIDDRRNRALPRHPVEKRMAVHGLSAQRDEEIARADPPRVVADLDDG